MSRRQSDLLEPVVITRDEKIQLSIIVPLYNEEDSVAPLYNAIVSAMDPLHLCYEVLFVDDGSRDDTVVRVRKLAENDPRLHITSFRRNYGQTPAMVAGIEHARGEILVTMDGDLASLTLKPPLSIRQTFRRVRSSAPANAIPAAPAPAMQMSALMHASSAN